MGKNIRTKRLYPGLGFRIKKKIVRPKSELVRKLTDFEIPDISDVMNSLYTINPQIKNLINNKKIIGTACTVKVFPGDNLMVHKALDIVQLGDIIVVDGNSCMSSAVIGDLMANKAKHRGVSAFVIDGLIRDISGIQELDMPVYAKGVTSICPLKQGPGEINFPISCGGVVVNAGDIICGDRNYGKM